MTAPLRRSPHPLPDRAPPNWVGARRDWPGIIDVGVPGLARAGSGTPRARGFGARSAARCAPRLRQQLMLMNPVLRPFDSALSDAFSGKPW